MEALPLDAIDYSGSYKLIGGRQSLDLVNTVSWPGTEREHDWLTTLSNITNWLDAVGLRSTELDESDIADIHQCRQILTDVLRPLVHQTPPMHSAVQGLNRLLTGVFKRRRIDPVELTWTWEPLEEAFHVLDPVILDAVELLTGRHDRLKHCPSCDWLFEDHTRNGQRKWCDMADCGSRAKARSYYHRHRALSDPPPPE